MQRLRGITASWRSVPGTQLANPATGVIIYTPPEPQYIPDKMADWERFANDEGELDPLIKMAILHYQFEAIHPFSDGNGRTGRIMNVLYLMERGLITQPVLYHSAYIIHHKSAYYRLLREVTENDAWEEWLIFMLDAIAETSQMTLEFIEKMIALKEHTLEIMRGISQKMPAFELNELLFSYPYIKIKTLMEKNLGTRPTVSGYLEELVRRNVLTPQKIGREIYYINHRLMDLLTKN
jgi:Fic family protein